MIINFSTFNPRFNILLHTKPHFVCQTISQVFIVLGIHNFEYNQEVARVEGSGIYDMVVLLAKNLKSGRKKHPSWCFFSRIVRTYVLLYYRYVVEKNFAHSCWTAASFLP
jgi:hypothetical protein